MASESTARPYCFVCMPFKETDARYTLIRNLVVEVAGLACVRHDDVPIGAGRPGHLLDEVHAAIDGAALVISDLTDLNPNVLYEMGYAFANVSKNFVLVESGTALPADLRGLRVAEYTNTPAGMEALQAEIRGYLLRHFPRHSLLQDFLLPPRPEPSFVLATPRPPPMEVRSKWKPPARKTYGDHVGIAGVLTAFGAVYGGEVVPDLDSATWAPEAVLEWDANLYLIGSPKANSLTAEFMKRMQGRSGPRWSFEEYEWDSGDGHAETAVALKGKNTPMGEWSTPKRKIRDPDDLYNDWGLIIRGPHPNFENRLVVIMAGPHSLGTGAACLAATRTRLIQRIKDRLPSLRRFEHQQSSVWVLLKASIDFEDRFIGPENVDILDAGSW